MEETPLKSFDEIFGDGWWDKGEAAEDLKTPPTNFGQNVHHQIDRQNIQNGQIEPNSTDQLGQIEPNSTDQLEQIEPNSIDQNPALTESDHSGILIGGPFLPNKMEEFCILILVAFFITKSLDKAESVQLEELEELTLQTFDELFVDEWWDKDEAAEDLQRSPTNFGQNVHHQIDRQNTQIGQIEPNSTDQNAALTEWKRKLGQTTPNEYAHSKQNELMKRYYKIKGKNPKIRDEDIAKNLKIGRVTLYRWKKQFKLEQLVVRQP
uniref:Uncharacterized protein n=1 Tax=Globodera rostochiensis TaxID=31243 RepID=A0A914HKW2_GLORO